MPSTSTYRLTIHCAACRDAPYSRCSVGNATFTTVVSRMTMNTPVTTHARVFQGLHAPSAAIYYPSSVALQESFTRWNVG